MIDFLGFGDCVYLFRHVGKANLANGMIGPGNPPKQREELTNFVTCISTHLREIKLYMRKFYAKFSIPDIAP